MTFEEYLQLLDEYWEIFGPIPDKEILPGHYKVIKL